MFVIRNFHFRYIKTALYCLLALALVVMLIVLAVVNIAPTEQDAENIYSPTPTINVPSDDSNKVKIQLAGDVVLNSVLLSSNSNANGDYDFNKIFSEIDNVIDGDLAIFNMEGIVDAYKDGTQIGGAPVFNYPKEIASSLKNIGFNFCVTANDRASYFSDAGIKNNYENILSAGLIPVGTSVEGQKNFCVREINGVKIGVLAYTDKLSNFDNIDTKRIATVDFNDIEGTLDKVSADVLDAKNQGAEIIVASMHWGEEMALEPTENQRELADKMVKCGVDVIYGTRAHIFQPVTYESIVDYNNQSKNVIIAYSMGNFLSHPTVTSGQTSQQSAVLNIYVERDQNGKAYISSAECEAIYIYAYQTKNTDSTYNYRIIPASESVLAETRPEIFLNDTDWQYCKDAYTQIKSVVDKSSQSGMPLGLK